MSTWTSSARMIGRDAELAVLRDALAASGDGHPRAVVIRGEAGIGKTRLLHEFLVNAVAEPRHPPLVIATGQCVDLGAIGAPFTPIRRLLGELRAAVGTAAFDAAVIDPTVRATLGTLVPVVSSDQIIPADQGPAPSPYLAEALETLLERLSQDHHLVLVIEDLHWADAATLALLGALVTAVRGRHLTLLATYRSDDVDRLHPLRPLLAELERSRNVVEIELQRLTPVEVGELLAGLRPAVPSAVETIAARSGGIPFLVEELAAIGGRQLPGTLRELVLARYERLTADAQRLMRVLAAGGVHVEHDDFAAVAQDADEALDQGLREAIDAGVIVTGNAGYTFRHALTQEAVHDELLPNERMRVHARYADRLAARLDTDPSLATAVAEHRLIARDTTGAFAATVAALQHGRSTFALAANVGFIDRLIELWPDIPSAEDVTGSPLPDLYVELVSSLGDLGENARGLRAIEDGIAACGPEDVVAAATLHRLRFVLNYNSGISTDLAPIDAAEALLAGRDDAASLALLSALLTSKADRATFERSDARVLLTEAISLAARAGDDTALPGALRAMAWQLADVHDDERAALTFAQRGVEVSVSPAQRAIVAVRLADILGRLGRFDDAVELADRLRDGLQPLAARGAASALEATAVDCLFMAGRPTEAVQRATDIEWRLSDPESIEFLLRIRAIQSAWNDEGDDWWRQLDAQRETEQATHPRRDDRNDRVWAVTALATVVASTWNQRDPRLGDAVQRLADHLGEGPTAAYPATLRRAALEGARLLRLLDGAACPGAPELRAALDALQTAWPVTALTTPIAALLLDTDHAPIPVRIAAWEAAASHSDELAVWYRHLVRYHLAETLLEAGRQDDATAFLEGIAAQAPGHGVALLARWARELAARAGILLDGMTAVPAPLPAASGVASLTPRELQVLTLVAEGLTNPQIGQRLFISPKTASVHVSAILAKIGAANRAEAAALYTAEQPA